jgi:hypothetical protein
MLTTGIFLKETVTGLCSGFQYGKAGDEVTVIDKSRPMWLIANGAVKFFIHPEKLSNVRIENPIINKDIPGEERVVCDKINPVQRQRRAGSVSVKDGQGSLFGD